jgi:hypothetical protein
MEVLSKIKEFNQEIIDLNQEIKEVNQRRISWSRSNSKEVKKLYPKMGKLYRLKADREMSWWHNDIKVGDLCYFKPTLTAFRPKLDFSNTSGREIPTVKGKLLDESLNLLDIQYQINIDMLEEVYQDDTVSNPITRVYVMLDDNTGYYKIGRSIKPRVREKTLQSEKPTIKMLFHHEATHKDEKDLHEKFSEKRIRGEWFDLSGSDLVFINNYFKKKQDAE